MIRRPPPAPPFPYTTLFRSLLGLLADHGQGPAAVRVLGAQPGGEAVSGHAAADDDDVLTGQRDRSEEHTSELQSRGHLVCRLLLEKKISHPPSECAGQVEC